MEQENDVYIEKRETVFVFCIKGDITISSESPLVAAYRQASADGAENIVLKFQEEATINSGGIGVLIQILADVKKKEQKIAATGLSEHFKKIFNMVGITKFARIYDSVDSAAEALMEKR